MRRGESHSCFRPACLRFFQLTLILLNLELVQSVKGAGSMQVLGCAITNAGGVVGRAVTPGWHSASDLKRRGESHFCFRPACLRVLQLALILLDLELVQFGKWAGSMPV